MNSKLFHNVILPEQSTASKHPTILFLHGRGADENDLLPLSEYFDERFLCISVRAPFKFPYGGNTWYDLQEVGEPDKVMFPESYNMLSEFFDEMKKEYPIDEKKIFLFGFSMGTVMSYALALTKPNEIAGVVANSGYIAEETFLQYEWEKISGSASPAFFVTHGIQDPVIPVSFGRRARQLLSEHKANVTYKEYTMQHQISEESLEEVIGFLQKQIID